VDESWFAIVQPIKDGGEFATELGILHDGGEAFQFTSLKPAMKLWPSSS